MAKNNAQLLINPNLIDRVTSFPKRKRQLQHNICAGLGECMVHNCYCKQYEGDYDTCINCGHNKERHW